MTSLVADLTDVDLFVAGGHHAVLARLRRDQPVYWNPTGPDTGFWALTRHDDVVAAYRDHPAFRSARGAMLGGSYRSTEDTAANRMLVAADPPRHRILRQTVHPAFSAGSVRQVGERIQTLVTAALDRLVAAGGGDFAADVATELPAGMLMTVFGIGHADAHHLIRLTRTMIGFRDPVYVDLTDDEQLRLAGAQAEIFEFFADLLDSRRQRPGDDLVSVLAAAEPNGYRLDEEEILYNCMNVAVGGNETSAHSACAGLVALMADPGQYDQLLAGQVPLDQALDEILRWSSTNAYVQRVAARDTRIRETLIRAGDSVTLWNVSANRDERVFAEPERFLLARSPNPHLTFGNGIHRCIGATMALRELAVLFQAMTDRKLRLHPAGPVGWLRSNFILGVTALPVAVQATA